MYLRGHGDRCQTTVAADKLGRSDLGKVMILCGDPKHGHCFSSTLRQTIGQFDRGECLIDCVQRTGKETGLLARNHRHAFRIAESRNIVGNFSSGTPFQVHSLERITDTRAVNSVVRKNFRGTQRWIRNKPDCIVVKSTYTLWMVEIIKE